MEKDKILVISIYFFSHMIFTLSHIILNFTNPEEEGNTLGKGENAGIQHFLLFPKCFLFLKNEFHSFI